MATLVELAVDTYVRAWRERDPVVRATLLEACFAADGRFVTRSRELVGRGALAELMARVHADPQNAGIRVISPVDAQGITFRFRAAVDRLDGTSPETFEAGQIDADGRISLVLTFTGPLDGSESTGTTRA
jgi:hypothetical protein